MRIVFLESQYLDSVLIDMAGDGESVGTCIDLNAFAYAHSGVNIALDVWIIGLPIHEIWKLNMPIRWKLQAMAMFAVGIL